MVTILKKILTAVTFLLLFIIQTSMGMHLSIFGIMPNLTLTFAICYAMNTDILPAGIMGCVCGFLFDVTGPGYVGYNALIIMYICIGTSLIANRFYFENRLISLGIVMASCFLSNLLRFAIINGLFGTMPAFYVMYRYILVEVIFDTIISIPMLLYVKWLKNEYIRGI